MSEPTWDTVVIFELPGGELYRTPAMDAVMAAGVLETMTANPPAWGRPLRTERLEPTGERAMTVDFFAFPGQPRDTKGRFGSGDGGGGGAGVPGVTPAGAAGHAVLDKDMATTNERVYDMPGVSDPADPNVSRFAPVPMLPSPAMALPSVYDPPISSVAPRAIFSADDA
jgi:hypothetical protein